MKKFATLRPLIDVKTKSLHRGFAKMSQSLRKSKERGRIQFRIMGKKPEHWVLDLYQGRCTLSRTKIEGADFEILTQRETWRAVASGKLSPAEAFLRGKMRVRGDVDLGKRVLEQLAAPGGDLEIC